MQLIPQWKNWWPFSHCRGADADPAELSLGTAIMNRSRLSKQLEVDEVAP